MITPNLVHLCWMCERPVDVSTCKTDEYGEAVHEACYITRIAIENGARKALASTKKASHGHHKSTTYHISIDELRLNLRRLKAFAPDEGQEQSDVFIGVP